jgi:hypothetical protein
MSTDDTNGLYRVLYTDSDGDEQVTGAMSRDEAHARVRGLEQQGHTVGSVMDDDSARRYMEYLYAPTYRGVKVPDDVRNDNVPRSVYDAWRRGVDAQLDKDEPKPANGDPFAPDLTMSREVADFVLRAVTGLRLEGYWPKGYAVEGRHGGTDVRDYDVDLVRRAADVVGRDNIRNRDLLSELDGEPT